MLYKWADKKEHREIVDWNVTKDFDQTLLLFMVVSHMVLMCKWKSDPLSCMSEQRSKVGPVETIQNKELCVEILCSEHYAEMELGEILQKKYFTLL